MNLEQLKHIVDNIYHQVNNPTSTLVVVKDGNVGNRLDKITFENGILIIHEVPVPQQKQKNKGTNPKKQSDEVEPEQEKEVQ